jgi:myo-inositol-1(or 4)-monophosphatase
MNQARLLRQVRDWARQAGEIAKDHFNHTHAQLKADNTLVTQADREVESFLVERVRAAYPGHSLIAEEGARVQGVDHPHPAEELHPSEYLWAIDPIDGTRAFTQGLPCWGISIGVLRQGRPYWGLFYMPILEDWTYTEGAEGVAWNGRDLRGAVRSTWDDQSYLAISSSAHYYYQIDVKRTRALGSVAANMAYTARGSSLGALATRASIWDLAASAAILARVGAELQSLSGKPIDWSLLRDGHRIPEPVLAAHPALIQRLRALIRLKSSDTPTQGDATD